MSLHARPLRADRGVADVVLHEPARGEKMVTSVPRSRCSFSCAPSRLSRISSSLILSSFRTTVLLGTPGACAIPRGLRRGGVVAVAVDDHRNSSSTAKRRGIMRWRYDDRWRPRGCAGSPRGRTDSSPGCPPLPGFFFKQRKDLPRLAIRTPCSFTTTMWLIWIAPFLACQAAAAAAGSGISGFSGASFGGSARIAASISPGEQHRRQVLALAARAAFGGSRNSATCGSSKVTHFTRSRSTP